MTREEIKELCIDEWTPIKTRSSIDKEFKKLYKKGTTEILTWHLTKGSSKQVLINCKQCGCINSVRFFTLFRPTFTGLCNICNAKKTGKDNSTDLVGRTFGRLLVLEKTKMRVMSSVVWKCECICGRIVYKYTDLLTLGKVKSCGCLLKDFNINKHRNLGHFVKSDNTKEDVYKHLKTIAVTTKIKADFNTQVAKDREYLCYFTCKNEWGNINVHHIQGKDKFEDLEFELSNLVCLRKDIHKEFHHLYGYGNNTAAQFYEFLTMYARR